MSTQHSILIVSRNSSRMQDGIQSLFASGYAVVEASSCEEGRIAAHTHTPDVMLLDVSLPDGDGVSFCQHVKQIPEWAGICILLLFDSPAETTEIEKGLLAGADDYLIYPISSLQVLTRVRLLLRMKRAEDALKHHKESMIQEEEQQQKRMMQEIQERKQVEEELRKLSRAVEQSGSTIVITGLNGNIEFVNPAFCRVTGYAYEEAIGANPRVLKSGQHPPQFYKEMWHTIRHGEVWHGEFINKKKNGDLYWESAIISPVKNEAGKITHYIAIKDDITERKQAERELKEAKHQAENANRAKSDFLARMSHEIRTPMNAIIGMTDLALETELTPIQQRYLRMAQSASKALLRLLNDILDLSRMERGRLKLEEVECEVVPLFENVLHTLAPQAHEKGIELVLRLSPQIPDVLIGDPTRIRQIMMNLVGNAVKFTHHGHVVVTVELADAHVMSLQEHENGQSVPMPEVQDAQSAEEQAFVMLHCMVADTGIGIPADRLQTIFESFTQADGSTSREYGGSGLGTTIARQLVELMHGNIWVESEVGNGSVFQCTIRLKTCRESARPSFLIPEDVANRQVLIVDDNTMVQQSLQPEQVTEPLTILLADDEENNQFLASIHLKKHGYRVITASDGLEAVKLYRMHAPDVVLMDIQMPTMNGIEASKAIRQIEEGHNTHTPIIALTADVMKEAHANVLEAKMDAYVTKPIDFRDLLSVIDQCIANQRQASQDDVQETGAYDGQQAHAGLSDIRALFVRLNMFLKAGESKGSEDTLHEIARVVKQHGLEPVSLDVLSAQIENFDFDDARQTMSDMLKTFKLTIDD